ncbi:MAG: penicillin acylase family protein [Blastocatellia bacterium]|nr:penicillin acylase family protein [Blastocatellia bacterium]
MKKTLFILLLFVPLCVSNFDGQTTSQTISVDGLKESTTVRRDARSIPYINAKNDADLYFAQGYVTASDRLWQMDLYRRVARGETAELFGKTVLDEDKRWRKFGFSKIAEESLPYLSPELKAALENYARGVNAYISTLKNDTLPIEFKILQYTPREWRTTDTIVIGKILADALSTTWQLELIRASLVNSPKEKVADLYNWVTPYDVLLFGKDTERLTTETLRRGNSGSEPRAVEYGFPHGEIATFMERAYAEEQIRKSSLERIGFYAEELAASNNWVISGKRTVDGKPILANDPHLRASAPGIWYLSHLSTPTMRVSGVTFPGVPGIVLGHNESIAWGATNVGPDVQDLYHETFNAEGKYKTPNGWEIPVIRKEEIKVRANPLKPETETVSLEIEETRNGVIFLEETGKKFALKWTARDPKNGEFGAFFDLNRAKDWSGFKNALKTYGGATQNFVYADVKGNIGWYAAGRIPLRKTGEGALPYDGATNDGEWTGYVPFEDLPNLYNPAEGFIVTANQRIIGTNYKYFGAMSRGAAPPWRARRIYDLLKAKSKVSMNDVRDVQHDSFNIPISNLSREIVKLEAASPETLVVLRGWDGRMTADSKGAVLANEIRNCLANRITGENKPFPVGAIREYILWRAVEQKSARWLPKEFSDYSAFFKACDADTRKSLADPKRLGMDETKWVWGNLFKSRFPHPLAAATWIGAQFATPNVGIDGSGQTPNVGSGVSMQLIASPGNWDVTRHVIPLGQSGDPKSLHYKDQFDAWRTGAPQIFPFSKTAVEKASKEILVMTPK